MYRPCLSKRLIIKNIGLNTIYLMISLTGCLSPKGTEVGQSCNNNQICNLGLVCQRGICVFNDQSELDQRLPDYDDMSDPIEPDQQLVDLAVESIDIDLSVDQFVVDMVSVVSDLSMADMAFDMAGIQDQGCVPEPEQCDGLDNDCDSQIDEELTPEPFSTPDGVCAEQRAQCEDQIQGNRTKEHRQEQLQRPQ